MNGQTEVKASEVCAAKDGVYRVDAIGGMKGSCLTYTVASTGPKNTLRSSPGILWKLIVFQEFRVRTQSQDLREEGSKRITTYVTLTVILHIQYTQHNIKTTRCFSCCG